MAAAARVRNTQVFGVRTVKGLFIMFTLLSLVCFTSSLSQIDNLARVKESHQRTVKDLERIKAQRESLVSISSGLMNDYTRFIDQLMESESESPESVHILEKSKDLLQTTQAYVDQSCKDMGVKIHDTEKIMMETKNIIRLLEEQQAEL